MQNSVLKLIDDMHQKLGLEGELSVLDKEEIKEKFKFHFEQIAIAKSESRHDDEFLYLGEENTEDESCASADGPSNAIALTARGMCENLAKELKTTIFIPE